MNYFKSVFKTETLKHLSRFLNRINLKLLLILIELPVNLFKEITVLKNIETFQQKLIRFFLLFFD